MIQEIQADTRTQPAMRKEYQHALRNEVEKIYGKKITAYSDCVQLTKEIAEKTGFRLNVNTIRRFFGVVQATYPPSLTTLEIFSQYAGFRSFEHFIESHQPQEGGGPEAPTLFLDYVSLLFEKVSPATVNDPTWYNIVRETIPYLEKYPALIDPFQRIAARTAVGLEIYFEKFVNIDQLNGSYGNGLRYYLATKDSKEAQLFGHSLLALRSFLSEDEEGLGLHYRKVVSFSLDRYVHPFVCGRYFATQVLYHKDDPEKLYSLALEARRWYAEMPPSRDAYQSFPCFELIFSEALVLVGQAAEALFYIGEGRKKKTAYVPPTVDLKLFVAMDVYEVLALLTLGETERARKALKRIKVGDFYFLSRRYLNTLYQLAGEQLSKGQGSNGDHRIYTENLAEKTGFTALNTVLKTKL